MNREPDDSDKVLEHFAEYEKEAAALLGRIVKRDEMVGLLKIAHPSKIAPLRDVISRLNTGIEQTEKILLVIAESIRPQRKNDEQYRELDEKMNKMIPEFLEYIAEMKSGKLVELTAYLSDDTEAHKPL